MARETQQDTPVARPTMGLLRNLIRRTTGSSAGRQPPPRLAMDTGVQPSAQMHGERRSRAFSSGIGFFRRKKSKEVSVLGADEAVSPEQIYAATVAALAQSRQQYSEKGSSGRDSGSRRSSGSGGGGSSRLERANTLPDGSLSSVLEDAPLPIAAQGRSNSIPSLPHAIDGDADADRAARVAAARQVGASIAKQVEAESATRATLKVVEEFRRYGENEAAHAARHMQQQIETALTRGAAALHGAVSVSFDKKGKARLRELAVTLKREESLRQTQFTTLVSRIQFSEREEDQMAAIREYTSVCRGLVGRLMAQLPHLPPAIAPVVSTYISVMSHHEALAKKALAAEDPRREEQEVAAKNAARLAKARCAAEARENGMYATSSVPQRARGR